MLHHESSRVTCEIMQGDSDRAFLPKIPHVKIIRKWAPTRREKDVFNFLILIEISFDYFATVRKDT